MSRSFRISAFIGLILATALAAWPVARSTSASEPPDQDASAIDSARSLGRAFTRVAKRAVPAVVYIEAERTEEVPLGPQDPGGPEDPFGLWRDDLLRRFFESPRAPEIRPRQRRQLGQGTGFIVDAGGTILTASHVVHGAEQVRVSLHDGRKFDARVLGSDPKSDVAVLDVEAEDLPFLALGDSERIEVGEWVLAVGNPFGLSETVTSGIVSAKGRSRVGLTEYEDFLQTDAAINPGNSGGPLLDLDGNVVGINSAILSRSGGSMGIGFAIPINLAKAIQRQLVTDGHVTRGFLGVFLQDLTPDLASEFGIEGRSGALVSQVISGTPASEAGLADGDVVFELDGEAVEDSSDLRNRIALIKPGNSVALGVLRAGEEIVVEVKLGRREDEPAPEGSGGVAAGLGLVLAPLDTETAGVAAGDGLLVKSVEPESLAALAGIRAGEVISHVGRARVATFEQFEAATAKAKPSGRLLLRVHDGRNARYVLLRTK